MRAVLLFYLKYPPWFEFRLVADGAVARRNRHGFAKLNRHILQPVEKETKKQTMTRVCLASMQCNAMQCNAINTHPADDDANKDHRGVAQLGIGRLHVRPVLYDTKRYETIRTTPSIQYKLQLNN